MTPIETMFRDAAEKFLRKVDEGTAHSVETYAEMKAALAALEKREFEFAELAAARVPGEMRMGEKAREEAEQVDNTTIQHLPVIPEARDRSEHMPKARRTS